MTARAEELARMLKPMKMGALPSSYNLGTRNLTTETRSWSSLLVNLGMGLIVLFIILLIVHYTVTPIFSFGLGSDGLIPLSKASDGELLWTDGPQPSTTAANFEKLSAVNFTLQMDVFVEDTLSTLGSKNRVFLYRATQPIQTLDAPALIENYPDGNLVCYLKPETNDLCVTVTTQQNTDIYPESAPTILNVPTRTPFRLTIVLQDKLLEVYYNGKLTTTKTLRYQPRGNNTAFYGTPDMFRSTVRIMNLQFWNYPLSPMQVMNAPPALATTALFQPAPLPTQGTCP